ncbi:DUF2470 domain-containing protein [Humidisolicoccus flavus]|uniref:DUF2470 domain-containing protein n=1 Tax=Humidisolicoccus flavus TaxID=3111414 RepID=UPI003247C999
MSFVFTEEIVAAVVHHMNDDHHDDNVQIVRAHTSAVDAESVMLATVDESGLTFTVRRPSGSETHTIAWPIPITERADIRHAVVALMPPASETQE